MEQTDELIKKKSEGSAKKAAEDKEKSFHVVDHDVVRLDVPMHEDLLRS